MESINNLNNLYLNKKTYLLQLEKLSELNYKHSKINSNDKSIIILENEIKSLTNSLMDLSKEIRYVENVINQLNQPSKLILLYKYEKNLSIGEIAKELNYSTKRIYQLHNIALRDYKNTYLRQSENEESFDR